jgi:hypothetical protein
MVKADWVAPLFHTGVTRNRLTRVVPTAGDSSVVEGRPA